MGKKETLIWGEHEFQLPNMPSDEKEILFHNRKKEDQYFRRVKTQSDYDWDSMSAHEQFKHIERERDRLVNGLWFFNKGVPTYITGKHYDHLTYQDFGYKPYYLESQRHDFYFRDILENDPSCYGGLVIKPRRYGYTDMEVTDHLYGAMHNFDFKTGMMSDTRDKVYETIYDKITHSYIKRPSWSRPNVSMRSGTIPKKKMWFHTDKVTKSKNKSALSYSQGLSLNSLIAPKSTTVMGYDGAKLNKLTMDEIWKWKKVRPQLCWDKQKKVLFAGGVIIGKAMLLSTMGDDDDYEAAIKDGIDMWHASNPFERDRNGMTSTGLYRYFVPGWYALHGRAGENAFADKYGFVNEDAATTYILNERAKFEEGSFDWTYEVRRFPLTIEEALGSALIQGVFDKKRIKERITIINKLTENEKPYVEGKLVEDQNGRVHFEKDKNEPWLVSKLPYISKEKGIDHSNRWGKFDNRIICPQNPEGAIGYDPVRYDKADTTSGAISKACILAAYKFDYFRSGRDSAAGHMAGMYLDRADTADMSNHEVLKAAKFWGFKVMFERQVESFLKMCRLPEVQMEDFLLRSTKDGKFGMWTNKDVWTNGVNDIRTLWKSPRSEFEIDMLAREPFIPLLQQAHDFDPKKLTKFDAIVAKIELLEGLKQIFESHITTSEEYGAALRNIENQIAAAVQL